MRIERGAEIIFSSKKLHRALMASLEELGPLSANRLEAEARQTRSRKRQALQHTVRELEKEIARLEQLQKNFTAELENPETYQKPGRAMAVNRELSAVVEDLSRVVADWEQASERLSEQIEASEKPNAAKDSALGR